MEEVVVQGLLHILDGIMHPKLSASPYIISQGPQPSGGAPGHNAESSPSISAISKWSTYINFMVGGPVRI